METVIAVQQDTKQIITLKTKLSRVLKPQIDLISQEQPWKSPAKMDVFTVRMSGSWSPFTFQGYGEGAAAYPSFIPDICEIYGFYL